jgi:uncharacterized protein (DUF1501 family)
MDRRTFVQSSLLAGSFVFLPDMLKSASIQSLTQGLNAKKLLIVQLSGGNDGLNCLVPFSNDLYYKNRPSIGLGQRDLNKINPEFGFNSNLEYHTELFETGELAIYSEVGYPNPNRSHFRSMDIWHSAFGDDQVADSGWLGRYLDASLHDYIGAIELDTYLSLALKGEKNNGLAVQQIEELNKKVKQLNKIIEPTARNTTNLAELDFLYNTYEQTSKSVNYLFDLSSKAKVYGAYPDHEFGQKLKSLSKFWLSGAHIPIAYVSLGSFDTHVFQKATQNRLLKTLDDSLKAFISDLRVGNMFQDVMILVFSEFGRRVNENGSKGTDHGAGNYVWLISGGLKKAGLRNGLPNLNALDEGDLNHTIDFRQVYASLLNNWLQIDAEKILKRNFSTLDFI